MPSSGSLSLVETNSFRRLPHLTLATRQATDAGLRRYLAARLASTSSALVRAVSEATEAKAQAAATRAEATRLRAEAEGAVSAAAASAAAAAATAAAQLTAAHAAGDFRVRDLSARLEASERARAELEVRRQRMFAA